jgi:DNA topoisomerase-6 subunit B
MMVEAIKHADDLFTEFKVQSVSEFFRKNAAMLGYTGKIRSLTTLVHEAVTNSLDACEEARILPEIRVSIKQLGDLHYRCVFEDNASGIPLSFIAQVFGSMLAGSKAHRNIQSRGQQGIGISGAVMYSQVTTGQPTRIVTSTGDSYVIYADVQVDVEKNIGKILHKKKIPNEQKWRGTQVLLEAKEVLYNKGKYSPYNYLKMTSISNPHARITFIEPDGNMVFFDRSTQDIPPSPEVIKPHPHGVAPDDLLMMAKYTEKGRMSSFLMEDFVRISRARLEEVESISKVQMGANPKNLTWQEAERIVSAFKQVKFLAPSVGGLIPIGADNIKRSLDATLVPEFSYAITRSPITYRGGIPFIVECGIAYGGKAGNGGLELIRYANRAPLVFDQGGCAINEAVASVDWKRYGIKDSETIPLTLFVNLISTHIPYTSAGKQAIANIEEIFSEMRFALMDAGRALGRFLGGKRRLYEKRKRIGALRKYVPETSRALARLTEKKGERIEKMFYRIIEKHYGEIDEDDTEETL